MTTTSAAIPTHPVVGLVGDVRTTLDKAATTAAWTMDSTACSEALVELARAKAQLAEIEMRVLLQADGLGLGHDQGFTSTAHWYATTTRQTKPAAVATLKLAQAL